MRRSHLGARSRPLWAVSALTATRLPQTRDQRLEKMAADALGWIEAARVPQATPGAFWGLLRAYAEDAYTLGLNDARLKHYVTNGLRYLEYLRGPGRSEEAAFDRQVVKGYQRYVAGLRPEESCQPPRRGQRRGAARQLAAPDEPRLRQSTQQLIVGAIGAFWEYADENEMGGFDPMPERDPSEDLKWRDRETRPDQHVEFSVEELLATPFVPLRGRSRFEHERNLLLALVWASVPTRSRKLREATWRSVQVWEVARDAHLPARRWSLEAALSGEVAIDDERFVLFLVVGDVAATKSDEWRAIPLVGLVRERLLAYAWSWIDDQIGSLKYLSYRARHRLPTPLREVTGPVSIELRLQGRVLSVDALRADAALWREVPALAGTGVLRRAADTQILDSEQAGGVRDLMWAAAASHHYRTGRGRLRRRERIDGLFTGVVFPSREGGPLSDAQVQHIWKQTGWSQKGWSPQRLRQRAFSRFETARWQQLALIGPLGGHRSPSTTMRYYAQPGPWLTATVARLIADPPRPPFERVPKRASNAPGRLSQSRK